MKGKKIRSLGGVMILIVIFVILYNHHFLENLVGNDEISKVFRVISCYFEPDIIVLISSRASQLLRIYDVKTTAVFYYMH